jgi:ribosomal protein S10
LALAEIIKFLDIEKQARNHFEATRHKRTIARRC